MKQKHLTYYANCVDPPQSPHDVILTTQARVHKLCKSFTVQRHAISTTQVPEVDPTTLTTKTGTSSNV